MIRKDSGRPDSMCPKEAAMENKESLDREDLRCEEKCVIEWVDCVEELDGSAICKTRERNCFGECS